MTTTTFQTGTKYPTPSPINYDSIHDFAVVGRTAKTVKVSVNGELAKTCRIFWMSSTLNDGTRMTEECCRPLGNYSMAPIMRAGREIV